MKKKKLRKSIKNATEDEVFIKLDLAKFAYGYTYDIGNYFKVSQALDFSSSVEELNDYISTFRW